MDNKTAEQELLPCPFCGGKAKIKQYCENGLRIQCTGCLIKKEQKVFRSSLEWLHNAMVKDWNTQHQTEALREENEKLVDHNKYLQTLQQNQADVIRNFHNVMQEHFGLLEFHSTDLDKHIRQFKSELEQLRADNERMRAALTDLQDQAWRNGVDSTTVHEKCKQALTPKD